MRPLVQCDANVMTFTASGQGFTHLLVDRGKIYVTACEGAMVFRLELLLI